MTDQERLQFVIQFAKLELGELREGDKLNLIDDFEKYFQPNRGDYILHITKAMVFEDLISLQDSVRALLADFLKGREYERRRSAGEPQTTEDHLRIAQLLAKAGFGQITNPLFSVKLKLEVSLPSGSGSFIEGKAHDLMFLDLMRVLRLPESERIETCPRCGKVFFRIRRQLYCARDCALAVARENYAKRQMKKIQEASNG